MLGIVLTWVIILVPVAAIVWMQYDPEVLDRDDVVDIYHFAEQFLAAKIADTPLSWIPYVLLAPFSIVATVLTVFNTIF